MFFGRLVRSAVGDLLSPQPTRVNDFHSHCEGAIACLQTDEAALQLHASAIVALLHEEEEEEEERDDDKDEFMGPCAEYLFTGTFFETLSQAAVDHSPQWCRAIVLRSFATLLRVFNAKLIPHATIHRSLNNLVEMCTKLDENELDAGMDFLEALTGRILDRPLCFHFFYESFDQFMILSALVPHLVRIDNIGEKARAALLNLSRVPEKEVETIMMSSNIPKKVNRTLAKLYRGEKSSYFAVLLDFVNSLARDGHALVSTAVVDSFQSTLIPILEKDILQASEIDACKATKRTREILAILEQPLLGVLLSGLYDNGDFQDTLTTRMDDLCPELAIESMQLFADAVSLCDQHVLNSLGITHHTNTQLTTTSLFTSLFNTKITDEYLEDAYNQCLFFLEQCHVVPQDDECDIPACVTVLLGALDRALDMPYKSLVTLTGVLHLLACLPHSSLTSILLDNTTTRCMYSILSHLSNECQARTEHMDLNGVRDMVMSGDDDHEENMRNVIVLEQFSVEIAAVVDVKTHTFE